MATNNDNNTWMFAAWAVVAVAVGAFILWAVGSDDNDRGFNDFGDSGYYDRFDRFDRFGDRGDPIIAGLKNEAACEDAGFSWVEEDKICIR